MPIELSCAKAVNVLRKKSQKFNTDLVTYRLSKFLNGCQGYNKLQPRILPRGLSSLIKPKNDDDDTSYYFHNRPQIKQFYRQHHETMEETVTTDDNCQVVKTAKHVKRVVICEKQHMVEHTKEVTTHKFYRATRKLITLRRATKKKKTTEQQHPIDATVKTRASLPKGFKSILRKQKSVDSFIPVASKDVDLPQPKPRGLHKSRSVDVDAEIGKHHQPHWNDHWRSPKFSHSPISVPDESDYTADGNGLELVAGKSSASRPSPIVVLNEGNSYWMIDPARAKLTVLSLHHHRSGQLGARREDAATIVSQYETDAKQFAKTRHKRYATFQPEKIGYVYRPAVGCCYSLFLADLSRWIVIH
jgi:hypothetical protein